MQDVAAPIERLHVPAYNWWNEGLHGVARAGYATVFPQAIGLAATWDEALLHSVGDVVSTEARAKYNDATAHDNHARYFGLTFWSPNINIFRDPRWGRGQETYGEDPFLTGRLGTAFVRGLQGDDPKYFKTIATPKHYAVHSGPEVLRHQFNVPVTAHDLMDTYTPAFRATIVEGHAQSVMCAYNSISGAPACGNEKLLSLLRQTWGFNGYIVSDCGAITDIYAGHRYVLTIDQASAVAVKAGTDLSCGEEYSYLREAVRNRQLSNADLDQALRRLFTARFRLGMFDPPEGVPYAHIPMSENDSDAHRQLALRTARESIVLLKNQDGFLPLQKKYKRIAVVGPDADSLEVLLGNYNGTPSHPVTPLEGIKQRFGQSNVTYAAGSLLTETSAIEVPATLLRAPNGAPGVQVEYFANPTLSGNPIVSRTDRNLEYNFTSPPSPAIRSDFSVRWTATLTPTQTAEYRLGLAARDGVRLFVDGSLVVNEWNHSPARTVTAPVQLQAGHAYKIVVEHNQSRDDSSVRLVWTPPDLLAQAMSAARESDVIVAFVGISPQLEGEEMTDVSAPGFFGGDRVDLDLPHTQQAMLEALAATGKPLVIVLLNGSAIAINWAQQHAAAILEAWYPGGQGGTAIADTLAGDYNPAGRLPVTFYKSIAQLPPFSSYSMAGRTYRYFRGEPLYEFGYGLSFSQYQYSDLKLSNAQAEAGQPLEVEVTVRNNGRIEGDEVVELYLDRAPTSPGLPFRTLQGFQRVHIKAGESMPVRFALQPRQLAWVDDAGNLVESPGKYTISVGGRQPSAAAVASNAVLQQPISIIGNAVTLAP
ncbi:MAG: glycoside hydrolase family 3 C-terminal domain-containing protein [Acidobacteria bacterium]|nr:glycoside hydrolase family 3 C-terminal domain-containing protein [Acidobacteriota bacterium]